MMATVLAGHWRLHESLVLVLAGRSLHVHPFQFKHPGCDLWVGNLSAHPGQGLFSLESLWMALEQHLLLCTASHPVTTI